MAADFGIINNGSMDTLINEFDEIFFSCNVAFAIQGLSANDDSTFLSLINKVSLLHWNEGPFEELARKIDQMRPERLQTAKKARFFAPGRM